MDNCLYEISKYNQKYELQSANLLSLCATTHKKDNRQPRKIASKSNLTDPSGIFEDGIMAPYPTPHLFPFHILFYQSPP